MKFCYVFFIGLLLSLNSYSQTITEVILPQFVQGINSTSTARVPYVCRLKINGLLADKQYRFMVRFVAGQTGTETGEGAMYAMYSLPPAGNFNRITAPFLAAPNMYDTLHTDANGSFTGWFMLDANVSNMFTPGNDVYIRITFNNGMGGSGNSTRATSTTKIRVINFGTTASDGTGIRSTPAAGLTPRNFVFLYDNVAGTGQPIAGTVVENDGAPASGNPGYAPFYQNDVNGVDKAWGTIIPNSLAGGIQKIAQYSFATGAEITSRSSSNGKWPASGGGVVSTIAPSGTIVLDGNVVTLEPGNPIKLSQQITFADLTPVTYGDADIPLTASASSGLPVTYTSSDPNVATIINNQIHIIGAGTTDITASQTGDDNYAIAANVVKQLQVNKAILTITPDNQTWVKGLPQPTLTVQYSGFVNGDDVNDLTSLPQVTTAATSTSPAGHYAITADLAASPNYSFNYVPGDMEVVVSKQPQSIVFNTLADKIYGDADFNPGATTISALPITYTSSDPNVATIINGMVHIIGPGTTEITATQDGNATWEPATPVKQNLTIRKAKLTIQAENKTRLYGQQNPDLTIKYTGFVKNETANNLLTQPTITTNATPASNPGDYEINVSGATSKNYEIEHKNGMLTILALPSQTISFTELPAKKYGDANFKLNASASSGLKVSFSSSNPSVAVIVGDSAIRITGAGTAQITASQAGNATNAPATPVVRTLTVAKAPLTLRADNKTKNQGEANPAFTTTYNGFVNGDNATSLTTQPALSTTAAITSVGGNYTIVAQGAASNNYNIQHINGVLTILPPQGEGQDNVNAWISAPGQMQVNVYAVEDVRVNVQLFDGFGTRVLNIPVSLKKGYNTYRLPIGNVTAGVYNLRVAGNGVMLKTKLVIQ